MSNCTPVTFSQDTYPTVYTKDASGACTVSSNCKLYQCGDDSSPYGYRQYVGVPTCSTDPTSPECRTAGNRLVHCYVNDCTCGGTSPCGNAFVSPNWASPFDIWSPYTPYTPYSPYTFGGNSCPLSDRQICQRQGAPSSFCTPAYPGIQSPGQPYGCYVGSDPCNILTSGTNLVPSSSNCLATCCPGTITSNSSPYFYPSIPIKPWWLSPY